MKKYLPFLFILLIWGIFSYPFLILGKVPFPSRYQVNFFAPWTGYPELAGPVKNNAMPDIITQIYPWKKFSIEQLKSGNIPLWNPYSFAGTPHLANYQSSPFFPLNILYFLPFSFVVVWSFLVILQPLLAGIFTYLFLRSLKRSQIASLISSVSFMFCGFLTTWMAYGTLDYAILFLPLALFAIEKYREKKKTRYLFLVPFAIGASFLAGHFQTSLYFLGAVVAYAGFVYLFIERKKENLLPFLFIGLGVLLSLLQVLPSIEFYGLSVRSDIFRKLEVIPLNYFPTFFAPDFFGNPVTRNAWYGHYAEWNGYAGLIATCLGIFATLFKRSKYVLFFSVLGLVSLLLALNTPILDVILLLKVPVLSTSAASRVIVLFSFSLALLAAFGIDHLIECIQKRKKKEIIIWVGIIILFFAYFWGIVIFKLLDPEKVAIAKSNLLLPSAIGFALIGVIGCMFFLPKKYLSSATFLILALLSFEMVRFATKWQPFDPSDLVFKEVRATDYYLKNPTSDRFYGDFTAENSVYYHLPSLGGYDPLYIGRYGEFIKYVEKGSFEFGDRSVVNFPKNGKFTPQALDFLGVAYIVHKASDGQSAWAFPFSKYPIDKFNKIFDKDNTQIFLNRSAFSRAFLVHDVSYEKDSNSILKNMFSSDLAKIAYVESGSSFKNDGTGSAEITSYFPNEVHINASSDKVALLVLTDNYYPGWNVYVNGKKGEILRTDYTFRGVIIPIGKSSVVFKYEPKSFQIGLVCALASLIGIISLSIISLKRKQL